MNKIIFNESITSEWVFAKFALCRMSEELTKKRYKELGQPPIIDVFYKYKYVGTEKVASDATRCSYIHKFINGSGAEVVIAASFEFSPTVDCTTEPQEYPAIEYRTIRKNAAYV